MLKLEDLKLGKWYTSTSKLSGDDVCSFKVIKEVYPFDKKDWDAIKENEPVVLVSYTYGNIGVSMEGYFAKHHIVVFTYDHAKNDKEELSNDIKEIIET